MPDITDGLTEGGDEQNVNSLDGFAAAMAGLGVEPDEGESLSDTSVAAGLVEEPASAPERGPDGRFVPKEEAQDTPAPETAVDTSTEDPAVAAYLAKYNGDQAAALKAAADAQSVIGRQGTELGQTREQLARLEGQIQALMSQQATPTGPVLSADQVEEQAVELATSLGYHAAATKAANDSLAGDSRVYDVLLRNWVIEDPIGAQRFDLDFQLWKRSPEAQGQQPEETPVDPRLTTLIEQAEVQAMTDALGVVAGERGAAWAQIAPHMDAALENIHPSILALVASNDPVEKLEGTRMIADRATLLALQTGGTPAPNATQIAAQAAAEAVTARKVAGSQVASGSLRPAKPPEGEPMTVAEGIAAFKRELMATETTNVQDGLTYGK